MKNLFLTRHAKSSWNNPGLADIDRPLNERGKKAAPFMGKLIVDKGEKPELLISSPANRALSTARAFGEVMGLVENDIIVNRAIYGAGAQQLLELVQNQDDLHKSIMLFGHNPTFTSFVNMLTGSNIMNVVTCGVVRINFEYSSWIDIDFGSGRLVYYEYPKKYANA
ncbi:MAG TPA: histidine phosphatase family protein [Candidatus Marinimicrobia bacterium]|mgnify:FL=1|nr:histidine phosphatase family protein [Candidatus Neomarinimicrobiota bacterium]HIM27867.1 histidine phosphatase family protein [Candidatus Neomarinimicrobiota bacterium]